MPPFPSPRNFENFFGFGNNTAGYKEEKKNYNRVKLRTYMFNPSFEMDLRKEEVMTFFGSLDMYKAKRTDDRYIYTVMEKIILFSARIIS